MAMKLVVPFALGFAGWIMLIRSAVLMDFSGWVLHLVLGLLGTWAFISEVIK